MFLKKSLVKVYEIQKKMYIFAGVKKIFIAIWI